MQPEAKDRRTLLLRKQVSEHGRRREVGRQNMFRKASSTLTQLQLRLN